MANINLLPWREEERTERQRQFVSVLGLVAVLGVVAMWSVYMFYNDQIENQRGRNNYLESQTRQLDTKIKEITTLETERKELVERMDLIQDLQKSRPQIVHLFDEIVQKIPEGMNMIQIERKNDVVLFTGVAESSPRISNFMRNLAASQWITKPDIDDIEDDQDSGSGRKIFKLKTKITSPNANKKEAK
ncbi:MAG: PilN domain-containing protein [Kangiellaceae bacterium]|nr:PilN domain-containing protein [Kangiellaceae bacterium]